MLKQRDRAFRSAGRVVVALVTGFLSTNPAHAALYTVTSLVDGGQGSLRAAIEASNLSAESDTIRFAAGLAGSLILTQGDLAITDSVTIIGPGRDVVTIDGRDANRIFRIVAPTGPAKVVTIADLTLANGRATPIDPDGVSSRYGGAIYNLRSRLTLQGVRVSDNLANDYGGAIFSESGDLTLEQNCVLSGNSSGIGGALSTRYQPITVRSSLIDGNTAALAGGLYIYSAPSIVIADAVVSSNQSTNSSPGGIYVHIMPQGGSGRIERTAVVGNSAVATDIGAGGMFLDSANNLEVVNSTFSGNQIYSPFDYTSSMAGGILVNGGNGIALRNSTIAANTSSSADPDVRGGGLYVSLVLGTSLLLESTLVGDNLHNGSALDFFRSFGTVNADHTLIEAPATGAIGTGEPTNLIGVDAQLLPLADNGGFTLTHALARTSPALEGGRNSTGAATDQRGQGFPRVQGPNPDIGALEAALSPFLFSDGFE